MLERGVHERGESVRGESLRGDCVLEGRMREKERLLVREERVFVWGGSKRGNRV